MNASDWEQIRHFSSSENWGDLSLIKFELVKRLDEFRERVNTPIVVTSGTQGIHLPGSQHYLGKAVDLIFPKKEKWDLPDLLCVGKDMGFSCGIYPHWKYEGYETGGMHMDVRDSPQALWIGLPENKYVVYSSRNVKEYFLGG